MRFPRRYPRFLLAALTSSSFMCGTEKPPRDPDSAGAPAIDSVSAAAPTSPSPVGWVRALGTEPFWALIIDDRGLRFLTPEDTIGVRFPPLESSYAGDTIRWAGETERATIDARIWPGRCSDGMSDRIWSHTATVRIEEATYEGCAERAPGASSPDLIGEWIVVDHRIPGISRMDDAEAVQWHGRRVHLGTEEAVSDTATCAVPNYAYRTAPGDSLLADLRITPAQLGLPHPDLRIGLTEVFCGNTRWTAMGATLIWVAEGRPYAPWDGVFFELRRAGT